MVARISEQLCERLVEHASHQCAPGVATAAAAPPAPSFDALASTFAGLSVATTWVAVGITALAIVVAIAGFAWGRAIVREAKEDARDEANRLINAWLLDQAPRIIRKRCADPT